MAKCLECIHWKPCYSGKEWDATIGTPCEYFSTIDVVEVVRCRNCKYGEMDDPDFPDQFLCRYNGALWSNGDFFCAFGERRKDENM